jgi:hypothetical protein
MYKASGLLSDWVHSFLVSGDGMTQEELISMDGRRDGDGRALPLTVASIS